MIDVYTPLLLGVIAGLNVFLGGFLVIRLKKYFNIILGFAGGVMLSIAIFEILPEIFEISQDQNIPIFYGLLAIIFGILLFHVASFLFPLHEHGHHEEHQNHDHTNHLKKGLGVYGVAFMIIHSFIDGFGIGAGFLISSSVGLAIAFAVIMHNFSDGINTSSTLIHSNVSKNKFYFLFGLNVLAPILGVIASIFLNISDTIIFIYLGIFAGSILYLAIADILPNAHAEKGKFGPILSTIVGIIFVIILSQFFHTH